MINNVYDFCASVFVLVFLARMSKYFKNKKILHDFESARIIVFLAVIFNAVKLARGF
jgi:hypothetical protein